MSIISAAIDEVSEQIAELNEQHKNAVYSNRGGLRREIRDLMAERGRLREMHDKSRQEETT